MAIIPPKRLFTATLLMPQGYQCQFKVYKTGLDIWDFINENSGLTIHVYKASEDEWCGTLSHHLGGLVQNNILITQAIFELAQFYRH